MVRGNQGRKLRELLNKAFLEIFKEEGIVLYG
jgi:hypothetical protein